MWAGVPQGKAHPDRLWMVLGKRTSGAGGGHHKLRRLFGQSPQFVGRTGAMYSVARQDEWELCRGQ